MLQEAPQLTTPSVFSSNDQPLTPHSPTAMLHLGCYWHPCRPYCCQQAQRPTFCALLTLPRASSLALPQEPSPSCSFLIFGRLSSADHRRAFFSQSGDFSTDLFWTTSTRFDLRETFITTFTFSLVVYSCEVPTVLSRYSLLWERIVFFFRVVSSFVCINLILGWTITHYYLFLNFPSSLVDISLQHVLDLF